MRPQPADESWSLELARGNRQLVLNALSHGPRSVSQIAKWTGLLPNCVRAALLLTRHEVHERKKVSCAPVERGSPVWQLVTVTLPDVRAECAELLEGSE
jgi:hypothetical protein